MIAPMLIGAGLGLANHFLSGGAKPSSTTQTMDPGSADYLRRLQDMSSMWAGRSMPGLDPNVMAAIQAAQQYMQGGQKGLAAVTGDQNAMEGFTNPGAQAMNAIFDLQRRQAFARTNASMTAPGGGAFAGNNRVGLAQGAAMSGINNNQAEFGYRNYQDAINRAMDLAHGIPGISSWLSNQGYDLTNRQRNWDIGSQGLMRGGWLGPISTTTTGQPGQQGSSLMQSVLGGAMAGASFGGAPGAPGTTMPDSGVLNSIPVGVSGFNPSGNDPSQWWNNLMGPR